MGGQNSILEYKPTNDYLKLLKDMEMKIISKHTKNIYNKIST